MIMCLPVRVMRLPRRVMCLPAKVMRLATVMFNSQQPCSSSIFFYALHQRRSSSRWLGSWNNADPQRSSMSTRSSFVYVA